MDYTVNPCFWTLPVVFDVPASAGPYSPKSLHSTSDVFSESFGRSSMSSASSPSSRKGSIQHGLTCHVTTESFYSAASNPVVETVLLSTLPSQPENHQNLDYYQLPFQPSELERQSQQPGYLRYTHAQDPSGTLFDFGNVVNSSDQDEDKQHHNKVTTERHVTEQAQNAIPVFKSPRMSFGSTWGDDEEFMENFTTIKNTSRSQGLPAVASTPLPQQTKAEESKTSKPKGKDEAGPRIIKRRYRKKKPLTPEQHQIKREAFLSRNREAASKCRNKKKVKVHQLEEDAKAERLIDKMLKKEMVELLGEVNQLRGAVEHCISEDAIAENKQQRQGTESEAPSSIEFSVT